MEFGPAGSREILNLWLDAGADLGNHSYSHLNINQVPLERYTEDIVKGGPLLREAPASTQRKSLRCSLRLCVEIEIGLK